MSYKISKNVPSIPSVPTGAQRDLLAYISLQYTQNVSESFLSETKIYDFKLDDKLCLFNRTCSQGWDSGSQTWDTTLGKVLVGSGPGGRPLLEAFW